MKECMFSPTNLRCISFVELAWNKITQILLFFAAVSIFCCARRNEVRVQSSVGTIPLELADGSKVTLREGSQLIYTDGFGVNSRKLTVNGEGYFEIKHDPRSPFMVYCHGVAVTVLGTAFNIRLSPSGEVEVTVTDGKVNLSDARKNFGDLAAHHQAVIDPARHVARYPETFDINETLAWYYEGLATGNRGMGTALSALERRYHAHIVLENKDLHDCMLNFQPDFSQKLEDILEVFVLPVNARLIKQGKNTFIIRGGNCQ